MSLYTRKGGRPKVELGRKKIYRINIKLVTEEYYSLLSKVKIAETTISDFVRDAMKNGYVKERLSVEQADYIRKLCGMANNLNQLVRKANVQGYYSVESECKCLVDKMDELIKRIEQ